MNTTGISSNGLTAAQQALSDLWDEHVRYEFATNATARHNDLYAITNYVTNTAFGGSFGWEGPDRTATTSSARSPTRRTSPPRS